jgi:hypothetical protein
MVGQWRRWSVGEPGWLVKIEQLIRQPAFRRAAWTLLGFALGLGAGAGLFRTAASSSGEPRSSSATFSMPSAEPSGVLAKEVPAPEEKPTPTIPTWALQDAVLSAKLGADAGVPPVLQFGTLRLEVRDSASGTRPNVHVVVSAWGGSTSHRTVTNAQGIAEMTLLRGEYEISLDEPWATDVRAELELNAPVVEKTLVLAGPGSLVGRVLTARGNPLEGATVRVRQGSLEMAALKTDAQGTFRTTVPPGIYGVDIDVGGFLSERRDGLQVTAGRERHEQFGLVALTGTLKVQALCDDEPCKNDVTVRVEWATGERHARLNREGVLVLNQLPEGKVTVRASSAGEEGERIGAAEVVLTSRARESVALDLEVPEVATAPTP